MNEQKTIQLAVELLKKMRTRNEKTFVSCSEDKIQKDREYSKLYQQYWATDMQLESVIDLLEICLPSEIKPEQVKTED